MNAILDQQKENIMTDKEHKDEIKAMRNGLNRAIQRAEADGLKVDISVLETNSVTSPHSNKIVIVDLLRPL